MNNGTLKEKMVDFFQYSLKLSQSFQKKTYQNQIETAYQEYQELYQILQEEIEQSDDAMEEIASYIPNYAADSLHNLTKRKKELQKIDNNMAMVTFFVPLMGKIRSEKAEHFTELLVQSWNTMFPDTKIGKSSVEEIEAGFKKGLCYITTAVCQSLNKPDDCYELTLLREYRDQYLMSTKEGEDIVKQYYNIAPTIVNRISKEKDSFETMNGIWKSYLQPCVILIEENKMEECKDVYSKMVHELQREYLYS